MTTKHDRLADVFERAGLPDPEKLAEHTRRLYAAGHRREVNTMATVAKVGWFDEIEAIADDVALALTRGTAMIDAANLDRAWQELAEQNRATGDGPC